MAVGSSGGHIYPALAIVEKLEDILLTENAKQHPQALTTPLKIHFVHSGSPLGKKILSSIRYSVHEISIGGLAKGQSVFQKIKTILSIPKAFLQSLFLIKKLKAQVVFGTGGAVTGPVVMAGWFMGCKTAVWEGNVVMGLANRWLTPFVSHVFTVFPKIAGLSNKKKQIICSYPLRKKICDSSEKLLKKHSLKTNELIQSAEQTQNSSLNKKPDKNIFRVLILGGSQGSVLLNRIVTQAIKEDSWRENVFIYHQTGEKSFNAVKEKYQSLNEVEAFSFSLNIEEYYKKCDLVFSRAGSGAIWELASYGKALVLIPLTYSAGGHQLKNALELSSKKCVEMIREQDFNAQTFKKKLLQLKQDEKKRKQMAESLRAAYKENGAQKIADWIFKQI